MKYERLIKFALDKITGEVIDADEVFKETKNGFEIRKQFHTDKIELSCLECEQKLNVSTSKLDRLHFKHTVNSEYCELKDGALTAHEADIHKKILIAKESPRHKELKNKIAKRLLSVNGINPETITIDNKFIMYDDGKRKPDVYCEYHDRKIVFEIQLSDLSLRYILNRYEFYKKHGIYLIWILDNFDIRGQGQLERDIKYLTQFQNFFKLDEEATEFRLLCDYKFPFITDQNKVLTKWMQKSVSFNEIKFSAAHFQIYYFNFGENLAQKEEERLANEKKMLENERKQLERERQLRAENEAQEIIERITYLRTNKSSLFGSVKKSIEDLSADELNALNQKLDFEGKHSHKNGKPTLNYWISQAKEFDYSFLLFILEATQIEININQTDENGISALQEIYNNKTIGAYKRILQRELFRRGYKLVEGDIERTTAEIENEAEKTKFVFHLNCYNGLKSRHLIQRLDDYFNVLLTLESAKRKKIIGFGFNGWIAFANNAIHSYKKHWEYIELAFRNFGLFDELVKLDKKGKGTFQKKLEVFYSEIPEQDFSIDRVVKELYPELFE